MGYQCPQCLRNYKSRKWCNKHLVKYADAMLYYDDTGKLIKQLSIKEFLKSNGRQT